MIREFFAPFPGFLSDQIPPLFRAVCLGHNIELGAHWRLAGGCFRLTKWPYNTRPKSRLQTKRVTLSQCTIYILQSQTGDERPLWARSPSASAAPIIIIIIIMRHGKATKPRHLASSLGPTGHLRLVAERQWPMGATASRVSRRTGALVPVSLS